MKLTYEQYLSKVHGGWLGKCLGGAAGAPVEGFKKIIECDDYKKMMRTDLPNDDLDLQLLWLEVLQEKGLNLTARDLADAWERQCWYPFNEYGIFLKNYERGIWPPYSGAFNNPIFSESEGCPIRSEIWGMIFPGEPEQAAAYAGMDASLDHAGEAAFVERYYAAMEAQAFLEPDIEVLLVGQLHYLPEGTRARACVEGVLKEFHCGMTAWEEARRQMLRSYAHFDFTNSVTNLGLVVIALLYGGEDIDHIINIAFRCGYDTDCTCATAAALYGIARGAENIPQELKEFVGDELVTGIRLSRTEMSIRKLSEETCAIGLLAAREEKIAVSITEVPATIKYLTVKKRESGVRITVLYQGNPAVGLGETCEFKVGLTNETEELHQERLEITQIPEAWSISGSSGMITLNPGEEKQLLFSATAPDHGILWNKNILEVQYGMKKEKFGIAGASEWMAAGPYLEALDKEDPPGIPSPHGDGCFLPTLECMVNNAVYLEQEYLEECNLETAVKEERPVWIHGYEDLLPLDEAFPFKGQGCIYLVQKLFSPEEREVFAVISNNDGFRFWVNGEKVMEKDEIRLYTPYNNYQLIRLKKGRNVLALKLLRRTENLKFGIALRGYEGENFHRKRWIVDCGCEGN